MTHTNDFILEKEIRTAGTLKRFIEIVLPKSQEPERAWMFRGHRKIGWDLIPKIDRKKFSRYRQSKGWNRLKHEDWLLKEFQT